MHETLLLALKVCQRNWAIYKKNFLSNILPTIMDPAFFIVSFGIGLGAYVADIDGVSYISYMAPGLAVSTALFTAFFESSYNFYIRKTYEGIYNAMLTTPIGVREIILGEFIWMALKGAGMSTAVSLVLLVAGLAQADYIFLMPIVGAFVALSCGGIGFIATSMVKNINQFQTVYTLLISPMFFFSGIFFPVEDLPEALQWVAKASPLFHGVKLGQQVLWAENVLPTLVWNGGVLCLFILAFITIAYRRIFPLLYR